MMKNVKEIFLSAGFDDYPKDPSANPNSLVSLLVSAIEYDNKSVTAADILKEIEVALPPIEAKQLIEAEERLEKMRKKEIAKQEKIWRREQEEIKRKNEEFIQKRLALRKAQKQKKQEEEPKPKQKKSNQKEVLEEEHNQQRQGELQIKPPMKPASPLKEVANENLELEGNKVERLLTTSVVLPIQSQFYKDHLDDAKLSPRFKESAVYPLPIEPNNRDLTFEELEAIINQYKVSSSVITEFVPSNYLLEASQLISGGNLDQELSKEIKEEEILLI